MPHWTRFLRIQRKGVLHSRGEDDYHWKIKFTNGKWEEFDGEIIYSDEYRGVKAEEALEFTSNLIEIFEDFLEQKGIEIDNPEKEESECPSTIYGSDFGFLQERIEEYLYARNVLEHKKGG